MFMVVNTVESSTNRINGLPMTWHVYAITRKTTIAKEVCLTFSCPKLQFLAVNNQVDILLLLGDLLLNLARGLGPIPCFVVCVALHNLHRGTGRR